jgi:hypothetical protein
MVEDPRRNEYAFLFRLIQERHREQFEQALQNPDSPYEAIVKHLEEIDQARDRAEEILYWLYLDSELRQQGKTLPDVWEKKLS